MIAQSAARVRAGERLARGEMRELVLAIMRGEAEPELVAELLTALHARGETVDEVAGAAEAMRELAVPLPEAPPGAVDTCGTGGDRSGTFNVSTVAALVVAGAGVPVAKHGNRAATSRCGSADVLEALGVRLDLPPEVMARSVREVGIGFLLAPSCHPAMARVAPIRRRIATPTIFNRLGPLTNPMRVRRQLVGVAAPGLLEDTLQILIELGAEAAWVVHGRDGLDELTLCDASDVCCWRDGRVSRFALERGACFPACDPAELRGGDPDQNAQIARAILAGQPGPRREVVLLNAAAALCVAGRAASLAQAIPLAAGAIDSGRARERLEQWVRFTREAGEAA